MYGEVRDEFDEEEGEEAREDGAIHAENVCVLKCIYILAIVIAPSKL